MNLWHFTRTELAEVGSRYEVFTKIHIARVLTLVLCGVRRGYQWQR